MTPEQRAERITREEREKPKGDGYWFDTDHLRVVEITDLTSRIAAAIREAEAAVHAKYAELVKAADKVIAHVRLLDRPDEESHLKRLHERAAEYRAARAALKGETK